MTDLLRGGEPPGEWNHGRIGGSYICFEHPDNRVLVLELGGDIEREDNDRPVEVWHIDDKDPHIHPMNYKDRRETIDETIGLSSAVEIAEEYMEE